jgi:AraC family transcriptional regulator, positive regulator of tynA and feaB
MSVDAIDRTALRAALMQHVRDHLTDRTLTVATVCRRFAISPRTLHNVFAGSEESFAATVRAQRLDSCADLISDPQVSRTITDIAAAHGFDDPTSFSRAFRRRFGTSPRNVRRSVATGPRTPHPVTR